MKLRAEIDRIIGKGKIYVLGNDFETNRQWITCYTADAQAIATALIEAGASVETTITDNDARIIFEFDA